MRPRRSGAPAATASQLTTSTASSTSITSSKGIARDDEGTKPRLGGTEAEPAPRPSAPNGANGAGGSSPQPQLTVTEASTSVPSQQPHPARNNVKHNSNLARDQDKKEYLEQSCWSWIDEIEDPKRDISNEHVRHAYRLHFPVHHPLKHKCKRNCKYNPRCFSGLNEAKWLNFGEDTDELSESEIMEDMESASTLEKRQQGFPAGLKNLGNTCYVNSYLQIWFHNVTFRRALYEWDPGLDEDECTNETLLEAENYKPRGKVASLQALFAMMEFTNRRAADPNDFIAKLGLDPDVQQDAQEFSKLFMSLLESSLHSQKNNEFVRNLVQNQFRGNYAYVTKCCKCNHESKTPSAFYELDLALQGQKTLQDCLADFTKDEKLDGDNQYFCSNCGSKQNAVRSVRLLQLPPVLNLQLNRFIFDMQTGRKKKLNSLVHFPEELDLAPYLADDTEENNTSGVKKKTSSQSAKKRKVTYQLTGVLMHVGAQASHGHYAAHIQEVATGQWYKFSDTIVEPITGKNPRVGTEEDPLKAKKTPKAKQAKKGFQSSNSAYMLVYMEKDSLEALRREEEQKRERKVIVEMRAKKNQRRQARLEKKEIRKRQLAAKINGIRGSPCSSDSEEDVEEDESMISISSSSVSSSDEEVLPGGISYDDFEFVNGLVYPSNFPVYLRPFIEQDRALLNEELHEMLSEKEERHQERVYIRQRMRRMIRKMPCIFRNDEDEQVFMMVTEDDEVEDIESDEDFEFIPTEWLNKYIKSPQMASVIETTNYLCVHGKLEIDKISDVKLVSAIIADQLYEEAGKGEGDRLSADSLCEPCVRNHCKRFKLTKESMIDAKAITNWLKEGCEDDALGFWVGKATLKKWRALAKDALNREIMEEAEHFMQMQELQQHQQLRRQGQLQRRRISEDTMYDEALDDDDEMDEDEDVIDEDEDMEDECIVLKEPGRKCYGRANGGKSVITPRLTPSAIAKRKRSESGSPTPSSKTPTLDLAAVQSRLQKIGTNISVAKAPSTTVATPTPPIGTKSSISVIAPSNSKTSRINGRGVSQSPALVGPVETKKTSGVSGLNGVAKPPPVIALSADKPSENNGFTSKRGASSVLTLPVTPLPLKEGSSDAKITSNRKLTNGVVNHENQNNVHTLHGNADYFNGDMICEHGNLCHDENKRRIVSTKIWKKLKQYFPHARSFPRDQAPCQKCIAVSSEQAEESDRRRELAQNQKQALADIFNERNRPSWAKPQLTKIYLISRHFVCIWREFARDPAKRKCVTDINNKDLLCDHGGLLFPIRLDTESDKESVVYMTLEEEWAQIRNFFNVDHEISVTRNKEVAPGNETNLLESSPNVCHDCVEKRIEEEEQDKLRYHNVKVYVRRVSASENSFCHVDPSDPEFSVVSEANGLKNGTSESSSTKKIKLENLNNATQDLRRSNRRQKVRGEKEVTISSDMLFRDFKVKLMNLFKIPPFDQNLFYRGVRLEDSSKTMSELRIYPHSLIYLKADEPEGGGVNTNGRVGITQEEPEDHPPEEGFKGTGLLSSF